MDARFGPQKRGLFYAIDMHPGVLRLFSIRLRGPSSLTHRPVPLARATPLHPHAPTMNPLARGLPVATPRADAALNEGDG